MPLPPSRRRTLYANFAPSTFTDSRCSSGGNTTRPATQVLDKTMVKLLICTTNKAGFTNQLARLLRMVAVDC
ncbi:hypothetical protein [Candidatus Desulfovibrio trichonymphae]|uniref:hypothetical protein n=1 Tax=Candidatus Desulfovibrio trichonymphae TaxID=1725232 RepID=UPI00221C769E|nr:hypothetical protein AGMMS49925_01470 [Deltaproteobacteria bacterium]